MTNHKPQDGYEYVATQDIFIGQYVRVFAKGDFVPAEAVERHGYDKAGMVAKRNTAKAKAASDAHTESATAKTVQAVTKDSGK